MMFNKLNNQGLLLCTKYAISPNFLGYCGPRKSASLIDHLSENVIDEEVLKILSNFETLYPYLQLIARKNYLLDPFDFRVVEAYWIGNSFLKPVTSFEYQAFSKEKLFLDKKLVKADFGKIMTKISQDNFLPHHAFHVFNIFKRTGDDSTPHTLRTMDECRIGWGKIIKVIDDKLGAKKILVKTESLKLVKNRLELIGSVNKEIKIDYKRKLFINNLKTGIWVSFHWGFICDILTERQVKNLEYYTRKAIEFYNIA